MFWLWVWATFAIGLLLGAFTETRIVVLAFPPLALASVYWVAVGWNGDDYDIGRSGLILFTAIFGVAFVLVWVAGSAVGRLLRRAYERPTNSGPVGS
jgi:hypothetical protein